MRDRGAVLAGIAFGVGLIYFLDPVGSRRRRALARDTVAGSDAGDVDDSAVTTRDLACRATGVAAGLRGAFRRPVDDDVLIDRLREQISGAVSHPHLIEVEASDDHVILRGPILDRAVDDLLDAVERGSGVREIIDALDVREVEALGPKTQAPDPTAQASALGPMLLGVAGSVLAGYGVSRRDLPGALLAAAGSGLLVQAATNLD